MIGLHGAAVILALGTATVAPRAGEAALMLPIANRDLGAVLDWADHEGASLLEIDTATGRVIARVPDDTSLIHAVAAGILPIAATAPNCRQGRKQP